VGAGQIKPRTQLPLAAVAGLQTRQQLEGRHQRRGHRRRGCGQLHAV